MICAPLTAISAKAISILKQLRHFFFSPSFHSEPGCSGDKNCMMQFFVYTSASELLIRYQEILHYMPDAACLLRPCCVRLNLFRSFTKYCACTYFNLVILISTQIFKRLAVHCHQICQQWHIHFLETVSGKIYGQICLQRGQVRSQMTRRWLRGWRRVRAPASWCFQGPVVPIFPLRCQFLALSCIREHYTGRFLRRHFHFAAAYVF